MFFHTRLQTKLNVVKLWTICECNMSTLKAALDPRLFAGRKSTLKFEY